MTKISNQSFKILTGDATYKQKGTAYTSDTQQLTLVQNLVITGDTNLQTTSPHNLMFSMNKTNFKQMARQNSCSGGCNATTMNSSMGGNMGKTRVSYASGGNVTISNTTIGSETYPALVYIDISNGETFNLGDSANDTTIYGVLYVETGSSTGTWNNNNLHAKVVGSVIVNGNLTNGKYIMVAPTLNTYNNLSKVGVYTRLPGSWTDVN